MFRKWSSWIGQAMLFPCFEALVSEAHEVLEPEGHWLRSLLGSKREARRPQREAQKMQIVDRPGQSGSHATRRPLAGAFSSKSLE